MRHIADPRDLTEPLNGADLDETVEVCARPLAKLVDKTILITGASGFVGSWIAEVLNHAHHELGGSGRVILLNRKATQRQSGLFSWSKRFEILEGDVRESLFELGGLDLIIHAATSASHKLNVENPDEMREVIVDGIQRVIDLSIANRCRLINLSSGAVYGLSQPGEQCFSENRKIVRDQFVEGSQYHVSKIRAEEMLIEAFDSGGLDFVNARLFAFLAPLLPIDSHFAAGNFIRDALLHEFIDVNGSGESVRSYLYGTDLATWLLTIATEGSSGESYNLGSPNPITIRELAGLVAAASNKKVRFGDRETSGNPAYVPCTDKIQTQLDLKVRVEIEDAIARTLGWWSKALGIS